MKSSSARRGRDPNSGEAAVATQSTPGTPPSGGGGGPNSGKMAVGPAPSGSGPAAPALAPVSRSGRFAAGPAADVARFTESVSFDWRLWRQDIRGSMAHARMLKQAGLLTNEELGAILRGLEEIGREG
jgi:hypothetical protein